MTGVSGTFQVGGQVTNGTVASAVVTAWTSGTNTLEVKSVTGTFSDGDPLTQIVN